jgi:hypothetical protein
VGAVVEAVVEAVVAVAPPQADKASAIIVSHISGDKAKRLFRIGTSPAIDTILFRRTTMSQGRMALLTGTLGPCARLK